MNYKKLMEYNPTEYDRMVNSKGQEIVFYEHPLRGDEFPVIIVCHELELADYTDFMETTDMMEDHKEYEPSFVNGKLYIGDYEY
jgi:hypothetical protein